VNLSEIDTSVYYPVTVPSTKFKTKYRPFRVREERALLTAQESEDSAVMLNTLESIVRACVVKCPKDLTTFDVEYLFLQLRAKSVGEMADVTSECTSCAEKNPIQIDITKATIIGNDQPTRLKLSEKLIVDMRYACIGDLGNMINNEEDADNIAIASSIKTIYFGDTVFHVDEADPADVREFILNRSDDEMKPMVQFIENTPTVVLEHKYACKKCGAENKIRIRNLTDFF